MVSTAMKLLRVLVMFAVVASSSVAFAEKEAQRDEISQADAEQFLAFFNKFVDAVIANKENCSKMAGAINGVIDAHKDVVKKANDAKAAKKKLPKTHEDKMMARVKEMIPAMQKCGADKDVKAAVGRLDPKKAEAPAEK
jgi:hypothetical protein